MREQFYATAGDQEERCYRTYAATLNGERRITILAVAPDAVRFSDLLVAWRNLRLALDELHHVESHAGLCPQPLKADRTTLGCNGSSSSEANR